MAKESKSAKDSLKDILLKTLLSGIDSSASASSKLDLSSAKDVLNTTLNWAGKSKDDFIQMLCRETGQALAQGLEGPVMEILKNQKIQVTFELQPKTAKSKTQKSKKTKTK